MHALPRIGRRLPGTAVLMQMEFGDFSINLGSGSAGTGMSGPSSFNGNDQGTWLVDLAEVPSANWNPSAPFGALCLSQDRAARHLNARRARSFGATTAPVEAGEDTRAEGRGR